MLVTARNNFKEGCCCKIKHKLETTRERSIDDQTKKNYVLTSELKKTKKIL